MGCRYQRSEVVWFNWLRSKRKPGYRVPCFRIPYRGWLNLQFLVKVKEHLGVEWLVPSFRDQSKHVANHSICSDNVYRRSDWWRGHHMESSWWVRLDRHCIPNRNLKLTRLERVVSRCYQLWWVASWNRCKSTVPSANGCVYWDFGLFSLRDTCC